MNKLGSDDGHSGDDTVDSHETVNGGGVETSGGNVVLSEGSFEAESVVGTLMHDITLLLFLLVGVVVVETVDDCLKILLEDLEGWDWLLLENGNEIWIVFSQIVKIDHEASLALIEHILYPLGDINSVDVLSEICDVL